MHRAKVSTITAQTTPRANEVCSLAWIEMRTIVAKVIYAYDLKWLNPEMDWHHESQMHILWHKPQLMVKVVARH